MDISVPLRYVPPGMDQFIIGWMQCIDSSEEIIKMSYGDKETVAVEEGEDAESGGGITVDNTINKIKSIIDGVGNTTTAIDLLRRGGVAVSYIDDLKGGAKIAKFCNTLGPIATYTGVVADTYLTGKDILQHPNDNSGWKVVSYIGRNGIAVWGLYNPTVAGGSLVYYVTDLQIGYLDEKGYLQNYIDTHVQDQRNGFYYY